MTIEEQTQVLKEATAEASPAALVCSPTPPGMFRPRDIAL